MTQSFRGTPQGVNLSFVNGGLTSGAEALHQVEAKYPALLFKQQLTAFVEKIYGMIRDNLKKEISPLLGLCIQQPLRFWLQNSQSTGTKNALSYILLQQKLALRLCLFDVLPKDCRLDFSSFCSMEKRLTRKLNLMKCELNGLISY
ncbi:myosin-9-like [Camellia sinensis]|uniref:myosin-9-like n=1 Tax=Camellia sinensis TaxID=4442 RepID=UPI0010365355|nr:myosin-9-like [Camellia sinensis]